MIRPRFVLITLRLILACNASRREISDDLSTPEASVRSYWGFLVSRDVGIAIENDDLRYITDASAQGLKQVRVEALERLKAHHYMLDNRIVSAELNTNVSATVLAVELRYRGETKPDTYKYYLTKNDGKWLIDDRLYPCPLCDGKGQVRDFSSYRTGSELTTKECEHCKGTGWRSYIHAGKS